MPSGLITKEIFGNFKATEKTPTMIYFKIIWCEIFNISTDTRLTMWWKSTTNNNTTQGINITDGNNTLTTGWTIGDPYIGGHRAITVGCTKTNHNLSTHAVLNIPITHALTVQYTRP